MKPGEVAKNIDDRFFKEGEAKKAKDGIEKIIEDFFEPKRLDTAAQDVTDFLREVWKRFSIGKYVDVFVDFAKAEKALYGFGERYRDHLMHVFNVHLMGLWVFSKLLKADEAKLFKVLKIREEADVIPFPSKYNKPRRLYYLWSLISTFHDIAIPIDRRGDLVKGFGRYLDYFKIETEAAYLRFPFMTQLDIQRYSDLMSKLFASRVTLSMNHKQRTYEIENNHTAPYLYLRSTLASAMNSYDHGVLGAYFLFRSIEEMFLSGKNPNPKYDLDLCSITRNNEIVELPPQKNEWNNLLNEFDNLGEEELGNAQRTYDLARGETKTYNDYVFEQDVNRAALAIALHNIDPDENPKIFPLQFSDFPLTCLLILLDELQEFHRPEGLFLTEVVRCREFPSINVEMRSLEQKPRIQVSAQFDLKRPPREMESKLVDEYEKWRTRNEHKASKKPVVRDYGNLVCFTWGYIFETIKKKISSKPEDALEVQITVKLEGRDPCGEPLKYESPNWSGSKSNRVDLDCGRNLLPFSP